MLVPNHIVMMSEENDSVELVEEGDKVILRINGGDGRLSVMMKEKVASKIRQAFMSYRTAEEVRLEAKTYGEAVA